ncbi:hypothetical protein D3C84_774670 [compost metagenome]
MHAHVGVLCVQAGNRRDQEVDGHGVRGADPNDTGQPVVEPLNLALHLQCGVLHFLHGFQRGFTDGCQRVSLRSAQKQRRTQGLLQCRDPPPDGGLIDPQHPRRAT